MSETPLITPPVIMGIVNVTPDSFSDGGQCVTPDNALEKTKRLIEAGASIIDFGAESTRPGSQYLPVEIEAQRLEPVLRSFAEQYPGFPISVDTRKSQIVELAVKYGLSYINDVSALQHDPRIVDLLREHTLVKVILVHMKGDPDNMQNAPEYEDLIDEIISFFRERIEFCLDNNVHPEQIIIDPGIGFGKTLQHNIAIHQNLDRLKSLGYPLLLGASRKRFINDICPSEPQARVAGTLASSYIAWRSKVDIIRVHDVFEHQQFFTVMTELIKGAKWTF